MNANISWSYGRFSVPAQPGITFHKDNGQVFLADDDGRFTIALDEVIKRNCARRTIRTSYDRDTFVISLFHTQNDEKFFAFFQIDAKDSTLEIEPVYGQIVFTDMSARDGIHLDKLQKMLSEITVSIP